MKIKKSIKFLVITLWLLVGPRLLFAQKTVPDEVRVLPDNFKEQYQNKDYDYVETTSFLDRVGAWFIDKIGSLFSVDGNRASNIFDNLKFVFYVLVIVGVVYIIIKIILNNEGRWFFRRKKEVNNILSYDVGENIQVIDFNKLIKEAIESKDYRLAVRYNYLLLLKKLDRYKVLTYDNQKTAYDYELEVEGSKYTSEFSKATYYYTYIWYGEFTIGQEEYNTTSKVFAKLLKQLSNE